NRSIIVTQSNRVALEYNLRVREHYFVQTSDRVMEGELLMIAKNNYRQGIELFNGSIVKVVAAQSDSEIEKRTIRIKLGRDKYKDIELAFRNVTISFRSKGMPVQMSVKLLDNFLSDLSASLDGNLTRAIIVDFNLRLPEDVQRHLYRIKNVLRGKDEKDSRIRELAKTYSDLIQNDPYYNAVICKYGYAMTCHKAQGGEWENAFVDMFRYGGTANENYFRWAYTAITRASKKLWYYRAPDFDYISNLTVPDIQHSNKIKVSIYGEGGNYKECRFERIATLASNLGFTALQDTSKQNQQIISFVVDNKRLQCNIRMWYGNDGYKNISGDIITPSSDDNFDQQCISIITESFDPEYIDIPLSINDRPFFGKLAQFVKDIAKQSGIKLLNITHEQYQDIFHLQTNGIAKVHFYYDQAGKYTYMRTVSSLGSEDSKLIAFRKEFL
ncbi:MAG: ATP-binding domain-containing protein, partial [Muribaculaceae bacterium]|nr:ATP-binding domain-containing protein [Muribaculaceae bacterium]